ncbi:MAG: extracellular solute-binding protein [Firmicutes bacterium]|nr:extracellular solute-binding protein [Bacillota bacterium]
MKKSLREVVFIVCFIFLMTAVLSACQIGKVATKQKDETATSKTGEPGTVAEEDVVLTVVCMDRYTKYVSMNDYPLVWQELEKRTGIKVKFDAYPAADYNTIVGTRIAANTDMPDILTPVGDILSLYESKVIVDHAPLIEKVGVYAKKHFANNPKYAASLRTPDGAIPVIYGDATVNNQYFPAAYMIRENWLKKINREIPKTIDDWYIILSEFKKQDMNGNGDPTDEIPLSTDLWAWVLTFADAWDVHVLSTDGFFPNPDGKVTFEYIDPKFKDVLAWLKKLYDEKILDNEFTTQNRDQLNAKISQNIIGATCGFGPMVQNTTLMAAGEKEDKYVLTPFAQGPEGYNKFAIQDPAWGFSASITSACKYPEIAMKWLDNLAFNPETAKLLMLGIEGYHYTISGEQMINSDKVLNISKEKGLTPNEVKISDGTYPALPFIYLLEAFNYSWQDSIRVGALKEGSIDFVKKRLPYLVSAFPAAHSSIEQNKVIEQYMADIRTYRDEAVVNFIIGADSLDNFDAYVNKLKSMGIDEVLKVKQQIYDAFKANIK